MSLLRSRYLIGAQVVQLGVFARTYRTRAHRRARPLRRAAHGRLQPRARPRVGSGLLLLAGIVTLLAIFVSWAVGGFGALSATRTRPRSGSRSSRSASRSSSASFFLSLLTMRTTRSLARDARRARPRLMTRLRPAQQAAAGRSRAPARATLADGRATCSTSAARPATSRARSSSAGAPVVGIELDPDAAEAARGAFCDEVLVGDVEEMELPFEHGVLRRRALRRPRRAPARPRAFLARVRPLLRPGGRLVLSRRTSPTGRCGSRLLAGRWRYTDRGILDRTHAHLFTRKTLARDARRGRLQRRRARLHGARAVIGTPAVERAAHAVGAAATVALRVPVRRRRRRRSDLGRHPREERRRRPRALPRGDRARSEIDEEVEVVVVDSGSHDGSAERAREPRRARARDPAERVRPRREPATSARSSPAARRSSSRRQDAYAADDAWLARLTAPLASDGRRRCLRAPAPARGRPTRPSSTSSTSSTGPTPRMQRLGGRSTSSRFEATLFSNVNSAIPRAVLGGDTRSATTSTMSEDQEWSRRVLLAGLAIVYEPSAAVRHSHAYTVRGGVPAVLRLRRVGRARPTSTGDESRAALRRAGARYASGELALALDDRPAPLDPVRGRLRARRSSPASSSGCATSASRSG